MNNTKVFLIFVLVILLGTSGLLGFQYWKADEKNKALENQVLSLEQNKSDLEEENNQLKSDVSALEDTNQEILAQVNELAEQISELGQEQSQFKQQVEELKKKSSSICTEDNSCKFRTPGSGFRCNEDGEYNGYGDYWCECTINCEVNIQG